MNSQVSWILETQILEGREEAFRSLMNDLVTATRANEPGTLGYEWSLGADGRECHIYEHYVDSAAVMLHLATFAEKYAARFGEALKPIRTIVYGSPNAEVREALADLNPVYMRPAAGFTR